MHNNYRYVLILFAAALMTSCSTYQVMETTSQDVRQDKDSYFFENSDLKITYNLWGNNGNVAFFLFNKSDEPIYIDWNNSHFIFNGASSDYWQEEEETKAFYSSFANAGLYSLLPSIWSHTIATYVGSSITKTKAKKVIQIPSKAGILVNKFTISNTAYYNCDFNFNQIQKHPSDKFTRDNSPVTFRNYITYSIKENLESPKIVDNAFFVSTITNVNQRDLLGKSVHTNTCDKRGEKRSVSGHQYPFKKPGSFFILVR